MSEQLTRTWADRWGECAEEYERFRPGPPLSYYNILESLVGKLSGQTVIDLGTGPGLVACELARRGAHVIAVDRSGEQILHAQKRAERLDLDVSFVNAKVEELSSFDRPLDLAIANMSWMYIDHPRLLDWLLEQLGDHGMLAISRFNAIYDHPMVELAVDTLRTFNVEHGNRQPPGPTSRERFVSDPRYRLHSLVYYEEPLEFSIEAWVGRWRASMPVVRDMNNSQADAFTECLKARLHDAVAEPFAVEHFVNLEIYAPVRVGATPTSNENTG